MALERILQIVHVSDLHFKDTGSNDGKQLNNGWASFARVVRRYIKKHDNFGWHEGTQGHFPKAPQAFSDYINYDFRLQPHSRGWFKSAGDTTLPHTWLVDTGDLTAFGDSRAIKLGKEWLAQWGDDLRAHACRSLIGNHDAWAGCHPMAALIGSVHLANAQKALAATEGWNCSEWLTKPLVVDIPGTSSKIELYGIDSVLWTPELNLFAAGWVTSASIDAFRGELRRQGEAAANNFRILAMHHPIAFPWPLEETQKLRGLIPIMRLLFDQQTAEHVNNDASDPDIGPLAHLILSGHTHAAHPAPPLPVDVTEIKQGTLGPYQLQLVGGALMLNKSIIRKAPPQGTAPGTADAPAESTYGNASIYNPNLRGQILRIYHDITKPFELEIVRTPIFSANGSVYREGRSMNIRMYIKAPRPASASRH